MAIHFGKLIKDIAASKGFDSQQKLAIALHTSQQNISDMFGREEVDTALLKKVTEILDFNFLEPLRNEPPFLKYKEQEMAEWNAKIEQLQNQLKEKEVLLATRIELVETQRKLINELEEKVKRLSDGKNPL
ncbi:hypothetical protein [Niabella sp.]|uniref:hypothetical protein n=1 Tax=Niabella sp. TaxID=1962976 RepID=UPI0026252AB7|nr:hypothetical protein [Niabella sp.]